MNREAPSSENMSTISGATRPHVQRHRLRHSRGYPRRTRRVAGVCLRRGAAAPRALSRAVRGSPQALITRAAGCRMRPWRRHSRGAHGLGESRLLPDVHADEPGRRRARASRLFRLLASAVPYVRAAQFAVRLCAVALGVRAKPAAGEIVGPGPRRNSCPPDGRHPVDVLWPVRAGRRLGCLDDPDAGRGPTMAAG